MNNLTGLGLLPIKDNSVKTEQVDKKQNELRYIRSERKVPGHTTFEYDLKTGEIRVAEVKVPDTLLLTFDREYHASIDMSNPLYRPKVIMRQGCVYRQALNKKNLIKRLVREGIIKA